MAKTSTSVVVKVETAVSKGLLTYAGLAGALGQYAAAVAVFLASDDKVLSLGPLGTATATLLGVVAARGAQAKAAIQSAPLARRAAQVQAKVQVEENARPIDAPQGSDEDAEIPLDDGLPEYPTHTGDVPEDQGDIGSNKSGVTA